MIDILRSEIREIEDRIGEGELIKYGSYVYTKADEIRDRIYLVDKSDNFQIVFDDLILKLFKINMLGYETDKMLRLVAEHTVKITDDNIQNLSFNSRGSNDARYYKFIKGIVGINVGLNRKFSVKQTRYLLTSGIYLNQNKDMNLFDSFDYTNNCIDQLWENIKYISYDGYSTPGCMCINIREYLSTYLKKNINDISKNFKKLAIMTGSIELFRNNPELADSNLSIAELEILCHHFFNTHDEHKHDHIENECPDCFYLFHIMTNKKINPNRQCILNITQSVNRSLGGYCGGENIHINKFVTDYDIKQYSVKGCKMGSYNFNRRITNFLDQATTIINILVENCIEKITQDDFIELTKNLISLNDISNFDIKDLGLIQACMEIGFYPYDMVPTKNNIIKNLKESNDSLVIKTINIYKIVPDIDYLREACKSKPVLVSYLIDKKKISPDYKCLVNMIECVYKCNNTDLFMYTINNISNEKSQNIKVGGDVLDRLNTKLSPDDFDKLMKKNNISPNLEILKKIYILLPPRKPSKKAMELIEHIVENHNVKPDHSCLEICVHHLGSKRILKFVDIIGRNLKI